MCTHASPRKQTAASQLHVTPLCGSWRTPYRAETAVVAVVQAWAAVGLKGAHLDMSHVALWLATELGPRAWAGGRGEF